MDGAPESESTRILILNLNYSIVCDEVCGTLDKRVTVIYDSERLKPILGPLGAKKMTIYCPADLQDYPYAVVDFPAIAQSREAFKKLQGQCLGYSGRHLRIQYIPLYDYKYGGRHLNSEDTRSIMTVDLPQKLPSPKVLKRTPGKTPKNRAISPQKETPTRMVVTKHGRRIQTPHNMVSGAFYWRWVVG